MSITRPVVQRQRSAWLTIAIVLGGCASLSNSVVTVSGADPQDLGSVSRITLDNGASVLLRAVDGKPIPGVQVPNALSSYTYVLEPGDHVLWVSNVPYGHPLIPQRIHCYVISATLAPGSVYELSVSKDRDVAILSGAELTNAPAVGPLVDKPWVFQRNCQWQ